jgi:hypothetical protein
VPDEPGPAAGIPLGPLPGKLNRLPQYDHLGDVRPFGPGEYLSNPDGSWSSEMTTSVPVNNQWWVVPTLWMVNGVPHRVSEDQAAEYAQQSGLVWPTFDSPNLAQHFSRRRETIWQGTPVGRSDMQRSLWSRPWPPRQ